MDPLSIVAASAGLVDVCARVSFSIHKFLSDAGSVDSKVQTLHDDVNSLKLALQNIAGAVSNQSAKNAIHRSSEDYGGRLWEDAHRILDSCKTTLSRLEKIFAKLQAQSGLSVFRLGRQAVFQTKYSEISLYQQQICAQRGVLHIVLSSITVCLQVHQGERHEAVSDNIFAQLASLQSDIRSLSENNNIEILRHAVEDLTTQPNETPQLLPNLREGELVLARLHELRTETNALIQESGDSIESAKELLMSATATVVSRSSRGTRPSESIVFSDFGQGFDARARDRVSNWVQNSTNDSNVDNTARIAVRSSATSDSGPSSSHDRHSIFSSVLQGDLSAQTSVAEVQVDPEVDADFVFAQQFYDKGQKLYERGMFLEAEGYLLSALHRVKNHTKYRAKNPKPDAISTRLAYCQIYQGKWTNAATTLAKFEDVEITQTSDANILYAIELLARVKYHEGRLYRADKLARQVMEKRSQVSAADPGRAQIEKLLDDIHKRGINILARLNLLNDEKKCHNDVLRKAITDSDWTLMEKLFNLPIDVLDFQEDDIFHSLLAVIWSKQDVIANMIIDAWPQLVTSFDKEGITPLHAVLMYMGRPTFSTPDSVGFKLVQRLLDKGANVNAMTVKKASVLHDAVNADSPDLLRLLLDKGANINATNEDKQTILHLVAYQGTPEIARICIDHGLDVDVKDIGQSTPLVYAMNEGRQETVKLLLDSGASPDSRDLEGWTPLHWAAILGNVAVIDAVADPEMTTNQGLTSLHLVIATNSGASLDMISRYVGPISDRRKRTLALVIDRRKTQKPLEKEIMPTLLQKGVNVNAAENFGRTPLHFAVIFEDKAAAQQLLECGAEAEKGDCENTTPRMLAKQCKDSSILHILNRHVAKAASVAYLSAQPGQNINESEDAERKAMEHVCQHGTLEHLEGLLSSGADPNGITMDGYSFLLMQIMKQDVKSIKLFLHQGADPNMKSTNVIQNLGEEKLISPLGGVIKKLEKSREYGQGTKFETLMEIAKLLLDAGADANAQYHGSSLICYACADDNSMWDRLVELLLQHGARVDNVQGKKTISLNDYSYLYATRKIDVPIINAIARRRAEAVKLLLRYGGDANFSIVSIEDMIKWMRKDPYISYPVGDSECNRIVEAYKSDTRTSNPKKKSWFASLRSK